MVSSLSATRLRKDQELTNKVKARLPALGIAFGMPSQISHCFHGKNGRRLITTGRQSVAAPAINTSSPNLGLENKAGPWPHFLVALTTLDISVVRAKGLC